MKSPHFWLDSLTWLGAAAIAWHTPASSTLAQIPITNPVNPTTDAIEIYVPPPETRTQGICSAFLPPAIDEVITRPTFRSAQWGVLVESLERGTVLYTHNATRHFIPASNVKLLTTAAALQKYSPQTPIRSTSLAEWIKVTNLRSHNWYADTLLSHIGGAQVARQALMDLGVNPGGFRIVDGSGLSRRNLASPKALVDTLRAMSLASNSGVFRSSLPVAGVSGTLRNRLRRTPAQGIVLAKTGTLKGVRALSGYLNNRQYGPLIFSILVNQPGQSGSVLIRGIDDIVTRLSIITACE